MRIISSPVLCNYYLTYRCNASCGFCDIWEKPSGYANADTVKKNLADLKKLGIRVIDFTGGEPLLHRDLPDFLSFAKELGFITTLTTNCLLYPKHAGALAGKVDMLHFSLDSAHPEKHDASRGVSCFSFVERSIEIALSLGEKPDILFTVNNQNADEIEAVYSKISHPNGLTLILNPIFRYNGVGEELSPASISGMRKWKNLPGIYLNEAFLMLREQGGNQPDNPVCRAGSSTIVIGPGNELILPCYHLGLKHIPIENSLETLWKSREVQKIIALEGSLPECKGCTINCYMEPSFAVEMNALFFKSLPSTLRYSLDRWIFG